MQNVENFNKDLRLNQLYDKTKTVGNLLVGFILMVKPKIKASAAFRFMYKDYFPVALKSSN